MLKFFLLLFPFLLFASEVELKNPEGREFWLCFMTNHIEPVKVNDESGKLRLEVFITSETDTEVTLELSAIGYKETVYVKAGSVKNVKISPLAQIKTSEIIEENYGLHIVSRDPIRLYGLNRRQLTTDTFMGFPKSVLGSEYRIASFEKSVRLMSEFAIVATEDKTLVTITPTVETYGKNPAGKGFTVQLNKGDVYQVSAGSKASGDLKADLTGSHIKSTKKIAVFGGHQCAYVPSDLIACNHLVEQMSPTISWGKHYYIGRLNKRSSFIYRVIADKAMTRVFEDYKLVKILEPGEFYQNRANKEVQITSTEPVMVAQYSEGFSNGDNLGDPMMLLVSPTQQFLNKYRFATPVNGFWEHFVNVVVPTKDIHSFKLNGDKVNPKKFKKFGTSDYSIAYLKVRFGTHEVSCDSPFGLSCYGFGYDEDKFDAYGNIGGQSFKQVNLDKDALPPMAKIGQAEFLNDNKETVLKQVVFISDDRTNDSGVLSYEVKESQNISFEEQQFDLGSPQVKLIFNSADPTKKGTMLIETTDLAGNTGLITICHAVNPITGRFENYVNEGKTDCELVSKHSFALFGKNSTITHSAEFSGIDGFQTLSEFGSAVDNNFGFGLGYNYQIRPKFKLMSRLYFDRFTGDLSALYNESSIRNPNTGNLDSYNENLSVELTGLNINLEANLTYNLFNYLYFIGGLRATIVNSEAEVFSQISTPTWATYQDGSRSSLLASEMDPLNSLIFGANIGIGFEKVFYDNFALFTELKIDSNVGSISPESDWFIQQFYINLGVNYYLTND